MEFDILGHESIKGSSNMLKKIFLVLMTFLSLSLSSESMAAFCPTAAATEVPSCVYAAPSTQSDCQYWHVSTGQQYITTYCYDCGACDAGVNGCIPGTIGCNQCNIPSGYDNGYWCQVNPSPQPNFNGSYTECVTDYNNPCQ